MLAVADTSPINYLLLIQCETLLPALYTRVVIPYSRMARTARPRYAAYSTGMGRPSARMVCGTAPPV